MAMELRPQLRGTPPVDARGTGVLLDPSERLGEILAGQEPPPEGRLGGVRGGVVQAPRMDCLCPDVFGSPSDAPGQGCSPGQGIRRAPDLAEPVGERLDRFARRAPAPRNLCPMRLTKCGSCFRPCGDLSCLSLRRCKRFRCRRAGGTTSAARWRSWLGWLTRCRGQRSTGRVRRVSRRFVSRIVACALRDGIVVFREDGLWPQRNARAFAAREPAFDPEGCVMLGVRARSAPSSLSSCSITRLPGLASSRSSGNGFERERGCLPR
jgi:hypothetical protein